MSTQLTFYPIPYRNTERRQAVVTSDANDVASAYMKHLVTDSYTVRPLFFYDLLVAGASSNVVGPTGITFTAIASPGPSTFDYSASATITIYGTAAVTEPFDILGFVVETPPSVSQ